MTRYSPSLAGLALSGLLALAGPVVAKPLPVETPSLPGTFEGVAAKILPRAPGKAWWALFGDPALDQLMGRVRASNTSIEQAEARLKLARAAAKAGSAARMPLATLDGSATHAKGPLINAAGETGDLFTARLNVSWEADLFGRLSGERAAQRQDLRSAEALLSDTTLLIEAETARTWFIGRHYAEAAGQAHRITVLLDEAQAIVRQREALGLVAPAASESIARRSYAARQRERELVLARDSALRQLGFLLGDSTPVSLADAGTATVLPEIPVGLPADLLGRRPDIVAAYASLAASDDRLSSERKGWLPAIGLTASGGAASASLAQLITSAASSFGLGALLSLPVFDGGRHKARLAGREAQREEAEARYRETVLRALREVNDALQRVQTSHAGLETAMVQERDGSTALARANQQAANGTLSRLAAIDSEVSLSERQISRSDAEAAALFASIDLMQALGGGWD